MRSDAAPRSLLLGFLVGSIPALVLGIVMGLNRTVRAIFDPLISATYPIPGLDVELVPFDSGAKQIAALGIGEIDVGSGAMSAGFYNALARGINLKIVADKGHMAPGYQFQTLFIRKDLVDSGAFKSLKDLKGKKSPCPRPASARSRC